MSPAAAPAAERAARRLGLRPTDLPRYTWLESVALDPRARWVATLLRRIVAAEGREQVDVDLHEGATGRSRRLSEGAGRASSLAWSRDGSRLAYVWADATGAWSFVADVDGGGTPLVLRDGGAAPTSLDWAPDAGAAGDGAAGDGAAGDGAADTGRLACVRWTPSDDAQPERAGPPRPTARTIRRLRYKQYGAGWVHDRDRQVWTVDLGTRSWRQRAAAELDHGEPRWSWGGDRIACTATAREQDEPLGYGQLLVLDDRTDTVRSLPTGWPGLAASPMWRHDDAAIASTGTTTRRPCTGAASPTSGSSTSRPAPAATSAPASTRRWATTRCPTCGPA